MNVPSPHPACFVFATTAAKRIPAMKNVNKKIVSYTRFSTEMQRDDSCVDQLRNIVEYCRKNGIDPDHMVNLSDKGESGTDASRPGFMELKRMMVNDEIGVLLVDDLSRLTRGQGLPAMITNIRFHGGRVIAVNDGYDSSKEGTDIIAGVKGLMNSNYITQLGNQVRRGQRGRVEDDGSAGDFPFGYCSRLCDPNAVYDGRGPKPKKVIEIDDTEAEWVRYVFRRYAEDEVSIARITKELNEKSVPKGHRSWRPGWHREIVLRMIENAKYIGIWTWGETTTIKDEDGKKRQFPVKADSVVRRERPQLRIICQELWEKAQARRNACKKLWAGGGRVNPRAIHPTRLLSGILKCGNCGASMTVEHTLTSISYGCTGHRQGRGCDAATRCPAEKAETALLDRLVGMLSTSSEWVDRVIDSAHSAFMLAVQTIPAERKKVDSEIAAVEKKIHNLLNLAESDGSNPDIAGRIREHGDKLKELKNKLDQMGDGGRLQMPPPDVEWIKGRLIELAGQLAARGSEVNGLVRQLVEVRCRVDVAPGKKRGCPRLEVKIKVPELLRLAYGHWSQILPDDVALNESTDVIHVALGEPTKMDRLMPDIVRMRDRGSSWGQIGKALGIHGGNACTAYARFKQAVNREATSKAA